MFRLEVWLEWVSTPDLPRDSLLDHVVGLGGAGDLCGQLLRMAAEWASAIRCQVGSLASVDCRNDCGFVEPARVDRRVPA